jgi:hypothetical protein
MTRIAPKHTAKALLGYLLERRLTCPAPGAVTIEVPSPWDAWWACYRAALPLRSAGITTSLTAPSCDACRDQTITLAGSEPPGHPGTSRPAPCRCLQRWAAMVRAPGDPTSWPATAITFALLKPAAPWPRIRSELAARYDILATTIRTLTTADTLRLYPEAYGERYVRERDLYLTSGPVCLLTLLDREPGQPSAKAQIRHRLDAGVLRNHLHMPDNPGEALADIAQFTGQENMALLYRRYDRDRAARRLAFYRAALGIGQAAADRYRAAS